MIGNVTLDLKYYILGQTFYKKNQVNMVQNVWFVVKVFKIFWRYDEELIAVTFKYHDNNRDKSTN